MAEGRMLKKAISKSRRLAELQTDSARMLYTWIIPHLDIEGRFFADPSIIKGSVVPRLKSFDEEKIGNYLVDMAAVGLIDIYEVDGDKYFHLVKFEDHQTLNPKREAPSKIPAPPAPIKRRCLKKSTWERLWVEWEKSDRRCPVCGKQSIFIPGVGNVIDGYIKLHVDHKLPISKGGTNDDDNLRITCAKCNLSKGNSIDNITISNDNSRVSPENSGLTPDKLRITPAQVKLREVKLSKEKLSKEAEHLPVDNSKTTEEDSPPFESPPTDTPSETASFETEKKTPPQNTHGERWTAAQGKALDDLGEDIKQRYGPKYYQQVYVWIQTNFNKANPEAVLFCLRRLIQDRLAGKSIPAPGRWLEAVLAGTKDGKGGENAKAEARESELEHKDRKTAEARDVAKLVQGIGRTI